MKSKVEIATQATHVIISATDYTRGRIITETMKKKLINLITEYEERIERLEIALSVIENDSTLSFVVRKIAQGALDGKRTEQHD